MLTKLEQEELDLFNTLAETDPESLSDANLERGVELEKKATEGVKPARTREQIKAEGAAANKEMMDKIGRMQGDFDLSAIAPRSSIELDQVYDNPFSVVKQAVGTGLDLASIPGRTLVAGIDAFTGDDTDSTNFATRFNDKLRQTTSDNLLEQVAIDPLTFLTLGSPSGRIIDANIRGASLLGSTAAPMAKLTAPKIAQSLATGGMETALQGGLASYDRPVDAAMLAPGMIANTILGRYGVRGGDVMKEGEKMLYKNITPTPTQAKASPVLSDPSSVSALLSRNIAKVGKEPAGSGMLKNIKTTVNEIGDRQDMIRNTPPTETNIFASPAATSAIRDRTGLTDGLPEKIYAKLRTQTTDVGPSNIPKYGVDERRIREKLLSEGGELYEDFKDLGQAGIKVDLSRIGITDAPIDATINSLIDYKRKLSRLAADYGAFDKPTIDQSVKAKLYREAVDAVDEIITDVTSEAGVKEILPDLAFFDAMQGGYQGNMMDQNWYNTLAGSEQRLLAPEMDRVAQFQKTQQEFGEILPWREVIEDKLGRLNADNPSLLDLSRSTIKDGLGDVVKSQATGNPLASYAPKGSVKTAQQLYNAGKAQILAGNMPKKTMAMKLAELGARYGIEEGVEGELIPLKRWGSVEEIPLPEKQ